MYQLANPQYFYLLMSLPLLVLLYFFVLAWQRKRQKQFAEKHLLKRLVPERSRSKSLLKLVLIALSVAFLTLALVNPQIGTRVEKVKRKGVDLVFAIDVSKSMLTQDVAPDRLERAKQIMSRTIDDLISDRVGIIAYASQAYPQLPITTDYGAARLFLRNVNTDLISSQGTAIAEAIELANRYFDDETQQNRLLVILSDGEDHEQGIENALEEAAEANIRILTVGLGTGGGGPIPEYRRGRRIGYKKNRQGETVISKRNEDLLRKIARQAEGAYISGNDIRKASEEIIGEIETMEKKEFESRIFADHKDQFQYFLVPAILLMLLDVFVLERRSAWLKRLKLFGDDETKS